MLLFIYLFSSSFLHLFTSYQLSPLIYFGARLNQFSFLFLFSFFSFLFILTPDKTHCLGGNWSGGSCFVLAVLSGTAINQVIYCVRDGPFSIEFTTLLREADAAEVLGVCGVHYGGAGESQSQSGGPACLIIISRRRPDEVVQMLPHH